MNADRDIDGKSVCPSVRPSVTLWPVVYLNGFTSSNSFHRLAWH